jgi:multicomponent Na+:H+ antiporter subunit E
MSGTIVSRGVLSAVLVRGAAFLSFWLILCGAGPGDLPVGVAAAGIATWTSLRLLPRRDASVRPADLAWLTLRFFTQSIVAGIDVARRAFDPRMPLRPGFVDYPVGFPPGPSRNVFATLTSLLPGTVPAGGDGRHLVYHCLDVGQPIVAQLAAEEAALARALGDE